MHYEKYSIPPGKGKSGGLDTPPLTVDRQRRDGRMGTALNTPELAFHHHIHNAFFLGPPFVILKQLVRVNIFNPMPPHALGAPVVPALAEEIQLLLIDGLRILLLVLDLVGVVVSNQTIQRNPSHPDIISQQLNGLYLPHSQFLNLASLDLAGRAAVHPEPALVGLDDSGDLSLKSCYVGGVEDGRC